MSLHRWKFTEIRSIKQRVFGSFFQKTFWSHIVFLLLFHLESSFQFRFSRVTRPQYRNIGKNMNLIQINQAVSWNKHNTSLFMSNLCLCCTMSFIESCKHPPNCRNHIRETHRQEKVLWSFPYISIHQIDECLDDILSRGQTTDTLTPCHLNGCFMNKVDKDFRQPLVSDSHFSQSVGSSAGFDSSPPAEASCCQRLKHDKLNKAKKKQKKNPDAVLGTI